MKKATDNIFFLRGNVGQTPELKETEKAKYTYLSIGENYQTSNGEQKVNWHRLIAWNKVAEYIVANVTKGMPVRVEGRNVPKVQEIEGKKYSLNELHISSIDVMIKAEAVAMAGDGVKNEDIPEEI